MNSICLELLKSDPPFPRVADHLIVNPGAEKSVSLRKWRYVICIPSHTPKQALPSDQKYYIAQNMHHTTSQPRRVEILQKKK